jgi:protein O-mannosyl-transferase
MSADVSPPSFFQRRRNFLTGVLLAVLSWMIYFPSTQYGFVYYDDVRVLKEHPEIYGQPNLLADCKAIFLTSFPREEPLLLRDVSWAIDSRIFGFGNPFGYHFGNVVLHGVVVAMVFVFLLGTTRRYHFALATATAYLLLAVHVEPVAWIMGRKDILSALFMLLALCAQTQRLTTAKITAQYLWYPVTLVCFVLGLLSKISVLTFPFVLFLHAVLLPYLRGEQPPGARLGFGRLVFREVVLMFPALAVSGLIYVWYQHTLAQMGIFDRGYTAHGLGHLWNLLMVNPLGLWLYLRQIFLPAQLAVLYSWPALQLTYASWQVAAALATVIGAVVAGGWMFYRRKDWFFYYAAFFVLMIPYLNLIYIGIWVADRYVYFAAFCVLAIAISVAEKLWQRSQKAVRLVGVVLVAGLVANQIIQIVSYQPVWRNGETLWQNHILLPHHRVKAYDNLGGYYYAEFTDAFARQDQPRMAAALHKLTIVVDAGLADFWPNRQQPPLPDTYFLFFLRSLIEEVRGEPEAALASLLIADQLHPQFDSTNLNLSRLYRKLAEATRDSSQRQNYIVAARDRFAAYLQLVYRGRTPPPEVRSEMAGLEAACAGLTEPPQKKSR